MEKSENYCPVCKNKNERQALVCGYCGAALDEGFPRATVTAANTEVPTSGPSINPGALVDEELIPMNGIAVYAAGVNRPVYVSFDNELIFGRKVNETAESMLDLTKLGGFQLGISRRHAMIRRLGTGYEIIDLASTNGTSMNNEQLIPNKPYPLASGSQLRLGRMRLFLYYRAIREGKQS